MRAGFNGLTAAHHPRDEQSRFGVGNCRFTRLTSRHETLRLVAIAERAGPAYPDAVHLMIAAMSGHMRFV